MLPAVHIGSMLLMLQFADVAQPASCSNRGFSASAVNAVKLKPEFVGKKLSSYT